jgi:hypothetical protein
MGSCTTVHPADLARVTINVQGPGPFQPWHQAFHGAVVRLGEFCRKLLILTHEGDVTNSPATFAVAAIMNLPIS